MHKRILGSLSRKDSGNSVQSVNGESPEATAARGVRLFCESGGPQNTGDEVLHLPTIVEAAESGPAAAAQAALEIRRFLSIKNYARAYVQYNAIMLTRILADNPGKSFTRNMDTKFVNTVKELLREGRDVSVQQILRETLESFEKNKPNDETLTLLREMWQKEKVKVNKRASQIPSPYGSPMVNPHLQQQQQQQQNYFARQHKSKSLPSPSELAQRVEEAKTSAKLLTQLTQSTPPGEVLNNELLKEFADRCASASRSMQNYIHSDSPAPDEDTLLTLIETNDALAGAMSRHQRAVLTARKVTGVSPAPQQTINGGGGGGIFNGPPPPQQYQQPPSQPYQPTQQPFSPPEAQPQAEQSRSNTQSLFTRASDKFRLSQQKPKTQAPSTSQAPTTGPNLYEAPAPPLASHPKNQAPQSTNTTKDPFGDANEAPQPTGMQAPLVPLNYGLPPDSMPVPGSPKGGTANAPWDSSVEPQPAVFGGSAAGKTENTRGLDGGGARGGFGGDGGGAGWAGGALQSQGAVQPRGEAPILQAPKPKYRF